MKIAIFTSTFLPKIDGIAVSLAKTLPILKQMGHEVIVFAPYQKQWGKHKDFKEYKGIPIVRCMAFPLPYYPDLKMPVPNPLALHHRIKKFNPDIVHIIDPGLLNPLGLIGAAYCKMKKRPYVTSYNTHFLGYVPYYNPSKWIVVLNTKLLHFAHNNAQFVLCGTNFIVNELKRANIGVDKLKIWPGSVSTEEFHPDFKSPEMRDFLSQGNPTAPLILSVGRFGPEKRLEDIKHILNQISNANLAFVGLGPHEQKLKKIFSGTNTFFAGPLKGEKLAAAYASSDIFIMPSPTETFGLVVLEAMASGCPVVGINEGGITDIIKDGLNGFFYEPGDINSAATKVKLLVDDIELRKKMSTSAIATAKDWSWESSTKILLNHYHAAIH